jgi:Ca2+-binding RTX toxin-like protein
MAVFRDPLGDTFGDGFTRPDIDRVSGSIRDGNLVLAIDFFSEISPPSFFNFNSVGGVIDLDLDQNPATGNPATQSLFAPPGQQGGAIGADLLIDLYSEQFTPGFVNILNTGFSVVAQAPIFYANNSLQVQVPLTVLGDDGALNFAAVVGVPGLSPSDAAPDTAVVSVDPTVDTEIESNDTIATAIDTGLNSDGRSAFTLAARIGNNPNIAPESDVDLYKVELNAGDQLSIDIDARVYGSPLDSVLRLFDSAGNELAVSDDTPAPDEFFTFDSFIDFTVNSSGTYYIGVSGFSNFSYDPFVEGSGFGSGTGDYTLNLTLTPPNEIVGTDDDDFLFGTEDRDAIFGLEGDDTILALAGNDRISGGDGDDLINAGEGNDTVDGDAGDDDITGGDGNDVLNGGDGNDIIFGDSNEGFSFGNDTISGGRGRDRIFGNAGDDQISGDEGNDIIDAGDGFDFVSGGSGNDRIFGGFGSDTLNGDAGNDQLNGGDGFDTLNGGDGRDYLFGGTEDDTLNGDAGADTLEGGAGFDFLNGGDGNDRLIGVDSRNARFGFGVFEIDTLTGGAGRDTFVLGDATRVYYDDGNPRSTGENDYALITDFNSEEDFIQLNGSADLYSLDFFTEFGITSAALIYDPGVAARGEQIAILQNVSPTLSVDDAAFRFV